MTSNLHSLTVNNNCQFFPEKTILLEALAEMGYYLPAACGGRGSCGSCRCRIVHPFVAHSPKEIPYLPTSERDKGIHLACEIALQSDIEIELPANTGLVRQFETIIDSLDWIGLDCLFMTLAFPENQQCHFNAGQYALLEIPVATGSKSVARRAYSFASNPNKLGQVGFLISISPGGLMSDYLRHKAHPGGRIGLIGSFGTFSAFSDGFPEIWIASGTGIAPFMAMAAALPDKPSVGKGSVTILFAGSTESDLPCLADLKNLCLQKSNLELIPIVYEGALDAGSLPKRQPLPEYLQYFLASNLHMTQTAGFLLCTNPNLMEACTNLLFRHGIAKNRIRYDQFF